MLLKQCKAGLLWVRRTLLPRGRLCRQAPLFANRALVEGSHAAAAAQEMVNLNLNFFSFCMPCWGWLQDTPCIIQDSSLDQRCCRIWMLKDWEQVPAGLKGRTGPFLIYGNSVCSSQAKQFSKCFTSTLHWCIELSAIPAAFEAEHIPECCPVQGHALVILSTCSALNCSKILNQVFIKGKSISFITMNSQCSALKLQLLKTWWKASSIKHPKPSDLRVLFRIRDNIHYRSTDCEEQNCKEQLWKYYCNWNDSESKTSAIKYFRECLEAIPASQTDQHSVPFPRKTYF